MLTSIVSVVPPVIFNFDPKGAINLAGRSFRETNCGGGNRLMVPS